MTHQEVTSIRGKNINIKMTGGHANESLRKLQFVTIGGWFANYYDEHGVFPSVGEVLGSTDYYIIVRHRYFLGAYSEKVKTGFQVEIKTNFTPDDPYSIVPA